MFWGVAAKDRAKGCISLLSVLSIVLIIMLLALTGCAKQTGDGGGKTVSLAGVDTTGFPDWLLEVAQPDDTTLPVSAEEKVINAFEKKKIGIDDYFTLRFAAAFAPETLPTKYASDPDAKPPFDHAFLFAQLQTRWDELSPATQEKLQKYVLPSDNPASYWYAGDMDLLSAEDETKLEGPIAQFVDWLTIVPATSAVINKNSAGWSFVVHYVAGNSGQHQQALWIVSTLHYAENKYITAGFPEVKDWVKVRIHAGTEYGEEYMETESGGKKRCLIDIQPGMTKKLTESVVAHEFFHCIQGYIPLKSYDSEEEWVWESSAVWAEEYVYPDHNTEHRKDKQTWKIFNKYFFVHGGQRDYARYLWWYFLYKKDGNSYVPVRNTLLAAKNGQKQAIEARPYLVDEFKKYALWGLNIEPYKYYHDTGGMPTQIPKGKSRSVTRIAKGDKKETNADLAKGGVKYLFHFIADDVKKVEFDLTQVNYAANPKGGVQMIYWLADGSVLRDVTYEKKVTFCRNRPKEKVNAVLFIVDNADLENMHPGSIPVDASGECVPEWSGTITATWTYTHADTVPTMSSVDGKTLYTEKGSITAHDTLVYDKEWDEFLLKSLDLQYDYREEYKVTYPRGCGLLEEYELDTVTGGGTRSWKVDKQYVENSEGPTRLKGDYDNPGGPYKLDLEAVAGRFHSHEVKRTTRKPCALEGITTPGPGTGHEDVYDNDYDEKYGGIKWPNQDIVLTMSPDKKRMTGSGEAYLLYDDTKIPVTIDVAYAYG